MEQREISVLLELNILVKERNAINRINNILVNIVEDESLI